jgi:enoyl-CoA hydratase
MTSANVLTRTRPRNGVVQLTLDRPEHLNALDTDLFAALHGALDDLAVDPDCRAVVLTGSGRAFCAGGDMTQFARFIDDSRDGDVSAFWDYQRQSADLVPKLRRLPQPVVVAVNGAAVGGGLSLTCASDIRIAADDAYFVAAGQRVGLSAADMGVGWLLPRLVGLARAQELMLTGRRFSADEALDIGMLARVAPRNELLGVALEIAGGLADGPVFATRVTKEALWNSLETISMRAMMDVENRHQAMLIQGPEHREGVSAFIGRREPDYSGVRNG